MTYENTSLDFQLMPKYLNSNNKKNIKKLYLSNYKAPCAKEFYLEA